MQPKTDRQTDKPAPSFGWFGLLMIAIISGLVIKLVGDPLVAIVTPRVEEMVEESTEEAEDWVDDQNWVENWQEHWRERLKEWLGRSE